MKVNQGITSGWVEKGGGGAALMEDRKHQVRLTERVLSAFYYIQAYSE